MANGIDNGHQFVDLGLPSGTKWATCNVGASKPEEFGDYFAWGEIETKSSYDNSNYNYEKYLDEKMKYWTGSAYGKEELEPDDDVAHVQWGGSWRMPTMEQFVELLDNITHICTTVNCVVGMLFMGNNGNYIFLPAAGCRFGTSLYDAGSNGNYWLRTLYADEPYGAYYLGFYSGIMHVYDGNRSNGRSVRPVRP